MSESAAARYGVPAPGVHRAETSVRRSRFLTAVTRADSPEAAKDFVNAVRLEYPDATHHCWAFVAGPPGSTAHIGMSDDGEPHGTAGRPILSVLLHSGVGEIVAVVTRYFGGTKLGTGGLARAYAGAVSDALASLPVVEKVELVRVCVTVPFAALDRVHRALEASGAQGTEATYADDVSFQTELPPEAVHALAEQVAAVTAGEGSVEVV